MAACDTDYNTTHCLENGLPMTTERVLTNIACMIAGYILFAFCFWLAHPRPFNLVNGYGLVQKMYPETWAKLDPTTAADFASRLHSSMNAIVVLGLIPVMYSCGIWGDPLANDCPETDIFFSMIVGYFAFDFAIVLYYRMAFWQVFIVHHCAAISPYLINSFVPEASACQFILGIFIQVEIATLFLNLQNMLELTERSNTTIYKFTFYGCYILWAVVRIALPLYICMTLVNVVMPYYGARWENVVCYICAFFVLTFCIIVWLFVLTPDVIVHLKGPKQGEVEELIGQDSSAAGGDAEDQFPATSFQIETTGATEDEGATRRSSSVWRRPSTTTAGVEPGDVSGAVFRSRASTLGLA